MRRRRLAHTHIDRLLAASNSNKANTGSLGDCRQVSVAAAKPLVASNRTCVQQTLCSVAADVATTETEREREVQVVPSQLPQTLLSQLRLDRAQSVLLAADGGSALAAAGGADSVSG